MRNPWSWIFVFALALAMMPLACDRGGGETEEGTTQEETTERPTRTPPPQVEAVCDGNCMRPLPSVGDWPRLGIHTVRYGDPDFVLLKNFTREPMSFDGWYVSNGSTNAPMPSGFTLAPGATVTVNFGNGPNTAESLWINAEGLRLEAEGEFALFASNNFESAEDIKVYVRWGSDPAGPSHIAAASRAELWPSRGYVPVCAGYNAFAAVGSVALPRGFRSMPDECFGGGGSAAPGASDRPPGR